MYCPSSVGTNIALHVSCGINTKGMRVVIMWMNNSGIAKRSNPLIKNKTPINISNSPNRIRNVGNGIKGMVFTNKSCTSAVAGDKPITFNSPNQKKITNKPIRANGIETLLKK
ncbi:hypothetical protein K8Q96_00890 [Candidatus Nomurabacteria bacterium]|nr:hypothetical protein [Candidatus Nomurabacteria bacterium]